MSLTVKGAWIVTQLVPAAGHKSEARVREDEFHCRNADDLSKILEEKGFPQKMILPLGAIFSFKIKHHVLKKVIFLPYCVQT